MIENYFLELKYQNLTKKLKSCIFLILNIWEKTVQPFIIHNDFHKTKIIACFACENRLSSR